MKVMITGVSGFVGSHLAERFKNCGDIVVGVDRASNSLKSPDYVCDLVNDDLCVILKKEEPDILIHCAGIANVQYSVENPNEDFMANTYAVHRLLFSMKECNLTKCRFLFLSSAAVYGQPTELPINEDCRMNPLSPYALHKKMAEDICMYFIENYHFDIKILRIFSTYGPGLKKQLFWDMYRQVRTDGKLQLWGTGKESRDYIYIDDLVQAIYLIAVEEKKEYVVWNIANGEEVTIENVATVFAKIEMGRCRLKFKNIVREGEPLNWCANIERLKELGYKKKVDLEDGVRRYVVWVDQLDNN